MPKYKPGDDVTVTEFRLADGHMLHDLPGVIVSVDPKNKQYWVETNFAQHLFNEDDLNAA